MHFISYALILIWRIRQQSVTLDLDTDVTHHCTLHYTRDQHLIGIMEFNKPSFLLNWGDLEYFVVVRRVLVMPFPELHQCDGD